MEVSAGARTERAGGSGDPRGALRSGTHDRRPSPVDPVSGHTTRSGQLVATVRDSFWFIPALCMLVSVVLVESLTWLDRRLGNADLGFGWVLLQAGASGSRALLAAIATSMLAAAATMFSITIAVLALTSSNYGPRLVGNFMSDRGNQLVLGVLVATSLYALLLLRHIRVLDLQLRRLRLRPARRGQRRRAPGGREHERARLLHPPHQRLDPGLHALRSRVRTHVGADRGDLSRRTGRRRAPDRVPPGREVVVAGGEPRRRLRAGHRSSRAVCGSREAPRPSRGDGAPR